MILKNKKTGELGYFCFANWNSPTIIIMDKNGIQLAKYNSIAELNAEWEDYEEPKEYLYIDDAGVIQIARVLSSEINMRKSIGNYFGTREEAEKAVEKLKAWKRLKDKGFEFTGWDRHPDYPSDFRITASDEWTCDDKDLDLLFGDEK